jgi:glyoxylase-like metal-dependent hydrolase (beta-lactamase superfamily II)
MNTAPSLDEIEVSVFGPGYGECILIHVGDNKWFIVDSCIEPKSKELPVLNYLDRIGVEPSHAVKMIIATHWHDDHVRGLSTLVETCHSAQFCLSSALRTQEFLTLIAAYGKRTMMVNSGVKEFSKVIDILQNRKNNLKEKAIPLKYAIADSYINLPMTS